MKKIIKKLSFLMAILLVTVFSCVQEDHSLSELQGTVRFGGISLEFAPMGSPEGRIMGNSPWVHVFPNSADLVFINKTSGQQYVLKYNPNDFSLPYSIDLPYGEYAYHSIVEGGIFSAFLPFEARGEFILNSKSLEITLEAETEYGLVTVKNQYVEKASISDGTLESDLVVHQDSTYWFLYVKGGTAATLNILESIQGSTISRELNIAAYRHYNFVLKLNEGGAAIIDLILAPFELVEEVILLGLSTKFFEENGTIKCPGASAGEKGMVGVKIYEAVDRALLIQRRDEGADLSCVCTTLVTDMSEMFRNYEFFNQPNEETFNKPIGNWDVSNVTNMWGMFYYAISFNQPIGNWDVSKVTDMGSMFFSASNFNHPIGNWDVSNGTNLSSMFYYANHFNQPIGNWDVSKVTEMDSMFFSASNFNHPIGNWDVSNVTYMSSMFYFANQFNQPIGNWDVSNVTNMQLMFAFADSFNQPIENWDVSNVTDMSSMFSSAVSFNQPIGTWDVSNVTDMSNMFYFTGFNQPIGNWDVGNVTNMGGMFSETRIFNQPIGNWDVNNVTNMGGMFRDAGFFNHPIGNWDVGNVTSMSTMFLRNKSFNQPIGNWDVSKVTNMNGMFAFAFYFNHPLGDWDVSKVIDMYGMFFEAYNFNQDLSSWCVQNIPSEPDIFSTESALLDANKPVWGTCPD